MLLYYRNRLRINFKLSFKLPKKILINTVHSSVGSFRGNNMTIFCVMYMKGIDVHRAVKRNIISIVKPTRCTNASKQTAVSA